MLHLAGGKNAYLGSVPFPLITREGLLDLNPDLIIELVPDLAQKKLTKDDLRKDWLRVPGLNAVKQKKVYIFTDTYLVIPGPRFIEAIERFHALFTSCQDH
jgi:iron complex transport system substrate-binding protein